MADTLFLILYWTGPIGIGKNTKRRTGEDSGLCQKDSLIFS